MLVDARQSVGPQGHHTAYHAGVRAHVGGLVGAEAGGLQGGIHQCQCLLGGRDPVQHDVGPGKRELQAGARLYGGRRELAHQCDQCPHLGVRHQGDAVLLNDLHRPLFITGGQRVIDRFADQSMLCEPP